MFGFSQDSLDDGSSLELRDDPEAEKSDSESSVVEVKDNGEWSQEQSAYHYAENYHFDILKSH